MHVLLLTGALKELMFATFALKDMLCFSNLNVPRRCVAIMFTALSDV